MRSWMKNNPRTFTFLMGCVFVSAILILVEGLARVRLTSSSPGPTVIKEEGLNYPRDPQLGWRIEHSENQALYKIGDKTIYQVHYHIDDFGRRRTPVANMAGRHQHLLFLGASFAFGEGVKDSETLPAKIGEELSKYHPYNYGVSGYGPNHLLAFLQSHRDDKLFTQVPEREGIAIYVFTNDHVRRTLGSMKKLVYAQDAPYFDMDSDGKLTRKGSFKTGRKILTSFYLFLSGLKVIERLGFDIPPFITKKHYEFMASLWAESKLLYKEEFGSDKFYILFYPSYEKEARALIPLLEQRGIGYFDYSRLKFPDEYWQEGNGHPTPRAYKTLSRYLARDIKKIHGGGSEHFVELP
jgi:hypothetical protein